MTTPGGTPKIPGIELKAVETDPRVVYAYNVAREAEEAFDGTMTSLGLLPIASSDRSAESLRRISLYLGTLFTEALAASLQLGILEMPRAQHLLNRQLLEYLARNRWFVQNEKLALAELDRLPKIVRDEVKANPGAFKTDPAYVAAIEANYASWKAANPALDAAAHRTPGITEMVKLYLDDPNELFWYYGLPSIITHGKTHGIQEVLKSRTDGTMERSLNSVYFERVEEMYRAVGYALEYGLLLAINFSLDQTALRAASANFASVMAADGVKPKAIALKKYR